MNRELLMLVEAISREKNVERDIVFGAVESALAQATKRFTKATSIFAWPLTVTAATTKLSAAGMWCQMKPASNSLTKKSCCLKPWSKLRTLKLTSTSKSLLNHCPLAALAPWQPNKSSCKDSRCRA